MKIKIKNLVFIFISLAIITNHVKSTLNYQFPSVKNLYIGNQSSLNIGGFDIQFKSKKTHEIISQDLILDHYKTIAQYNQIQPKLNLQITFILQIIDHAKDYKDVTKTYENYSILIDLKGNTEIQCYGYVSFLRAIETLAQLISFEGIIYQAPIFIKDQPSYAHRGVLLDTARTFYPIDVIYKIIKGMQITKLNVFHWHITDSESFPMFLKAYPQITKNGAYSDKEVYSTEDIQKLVEYAQSLGVVIIPEVDSPSHTRSWTNPPEFNELNACHSYPPKDWAIYCLEPPCGLLDVTLDKTYDLIKSIYEQIQELFSSDYIHIGVDEIIEKCWDFKPSIKEWMAKNNLNTYIQLIQYYIDRQAKLVESKKQKIYWFNSDSKELKYPENSVIQFWGQSTSYSDLLQFTQPVILSPYDYLYFDCGTQNQLGDPKWCTPYSTWKHIYYNYKPSIANLGKRLLGSEVCIWSEFQQPNNVLQALWPRATAYSLKQWNDEQTLDQPTLVKTLLQYNNLFNQQGIETGPVTDEFCENNVDKCFFK